MRHLNRTELLVIIVLAVVVLAIAFPWLEMSREKARLYKCQDNLRKIGLAMTDYEEFNAGRFPPGTFGGEKLSPDKRLAWTVPVMLLKKKEGSSGSCVRSHPTSS
jgi:type II secretory pathway pseudopilin PulG